MKTCIIFVLLVLHVTANAQSPQQQAIQAFPELGVEGSRFNRAYLQAYEAAKAKNDPILRSAEWPLMLAKRVAVELPPIGEIRLTNGLVFSDSAISYYFSDGVELSTENNKIKARWSQILEPARSKLIAIAEKEAENSKAKANEDAALNQLSMRAVFEPIYFEKEETTGFLYLVSKDEYGEERVSKDYETVVLAEGISKSHGAGVKFVGTLYRIGFTNDSLRRPLFTMEREKALRLLRK